jgi:hypothetical protein
MKHQTLLAAFGVPGHSWHLSVVPELARLLTFAVVGDPGGALITVGLRQQTPLLGSVPISQSADGSSTVVALIRYRASLVALAVRYSASYLLAQPEPFRAALLQHWVHVYRADALEAILAARLLAAEMERVADGERAQ